MYVCLHIDTDTLFCSRSADVNIHNGIVAVPGKIHEPLIYVHTRVSNTRVIYLSSLEAIGTVSGAEE